jgi:hypothetical protein
MNSDFFFKYFYAGIVQSNLCWKIHNKYVFHVNIHIFVLKYLVQIQIIQNKFKISEGGKWNSHQMLCVYSSRMVKHYRICPIRMEIIHGRHRVVQIYACHELFLNCKPTKIREMLLTTSAHNQHDVIDVIWRLPVWKAKIRHYLASCTLQMWSNLTKISFQGRHSNPLSATYFSWRVSIDFWRNVYIDRSVTSRIETIVWRYNALSALGYNMGIRKIQLNAIFRQIKYQPELF